MSYSDERKVSPPKGVPTNLIDCAETLRWARAVLGESINWPDGQMKIQFQEQVKILIDGQVIGTPRGSAIDDKSKDLKSALDEIATLKLQLSTSQRQHSTGEEANHEDQPFSRMRTIRNFIIVAIIAFAIGLVM